MKIYYGTQELSSETLERMVTVAEKALHQNQLRENEVVVCRSETQLGTIVQWWTAQRLHFIPMFTAPDYNLEESYAHRCYSIDLILDMKADGTCAVTRLPASPTAKPLTLPQTGIIQMTSATTGEAKMVLRTWDNIKAETDRYLEQMQFTEQDCFMTMAPFYHSYAFFCVLLMCERTGASLVLPDIVLPRRLIELTGKQKVNCLYAIPYIFDKMTEVTTFDTLGSEMKVIMSTAQSVSDELAQRFADKFGYDIYSQYGSTEIGCVGMARVLGSDGFMTPLNGVTFETIRNNSDQQQLVIRMDDSAGYYILEDGVRCVNQNGYLTNDLAQLAEDGRVKILGRADRVIIRTGEKVDAGYVERILCGFPNMHKATVKPNERNELICEYATKNEEEVDVPGLKKYCQQYLLAFQIPERFVYNKCLRNSGRSWKELH